MRLLEDNAYVALHSASELARKYGFESWRNASFSVFDRLLDKLERAQTDDDLAPIRKEVQGFRELCTHMTSSVERLWDYNVDAMSPKIEEALREECHRVIDKIVDLAGAEKDDPTRARIIIDQLANAYHELQNLRFDISTNQKPADAKSPTPWR